MSSPPSPARAARAAAAAARFDRLRSARSLTACSRARLAIVWGFLEAIRVLGERLVALADDRAVVDEQILAAFVGDDEAVPLVGVEPLYGSGCHRKTPPLLLRNGQRRRTV